MAHAVKGDRITIRDTNGGDWVNLGGTYVVESVIESEEEYEAGFYLKGVDISWYASEGHYTIVSGFPIHPKYDPFHTRNTVRRWRDVAAEEWDCIGEIDLPPIGKDVEVQDIDAGNSHKEDSFYSDEYGWMPMKAFVLAEYYNQPITNRGTAALNTTDHGKSKISTGRSIEVQRPLASISTGQRTSRGGVQGRGNGSITRGRYSSHEAITGR